MTNKNENETTEQRVRNAVCILKPTILSQRGGKTDYAALSALTKRRLDIEVQMGGGTFVERTFVERTLFEEHSS